MPNIVALKDFLDKRNKILLYEHNNLDCKRVVDIDKYTVKNNVKKYINILKNMK